MIYRLKKIWNPGIFQGFNRKDHYFEGWYYKMVAPGGKHVLAVIPGMARNEKSGDSHSFVQVLNGTTGGVQYHRYPADAFSASKTEHDIRVGASRFRPGKIELDIDDKEGSLKGSLTFGALAPWPVTFFHPGYMGWYAFVPFMQCNHGVLSFDHSITGSLHHNDTSIDFTNGRGYLEKDWGTSFPGSWIWMQSNHFEESGISWMCSIATIPWLGSQFTGFGAGLYLKGSFYPFNTWNGAKIQKLTASKTRTTFTLLHRSYRIEVDASGQSGAKLRSPVFGEMADTVLESLQGEIRLRFYLEEKGGWREVFSGIGQNSGLEISLSKNGVKNFCSSLES